ncbi:hypothetical protein HF846_16450 [Clostridium cadaveris]|uniref:Relaxase n=1 Tax=Clostridium cadaveris TaxID=1529 RepID=A0A316MBB1_9CLOT|nr:MobP2 family relaxase [Clostridium cadaveris]NME66170.1 hypothetical protein [Clostridium cadaveris]PWL55058.1 MAG: hypothetical protein DBY38_02835 [Clostridium cadaveris]UFH65821.1 hypothetical protein KQH81_04590 [Clostridium cadaveris]
MSTPGIILTSDFVLPNGLMKNGEAVQFNDYVEYMNREEARKEKIQKDYEGYNDYMGNPNKNGSLFTKDKESLNDEEIKEVKRLFKEAQNKHSILWQDVFSFNNEWLEKQGLYDSKTRILDEEKIQIAVRNAMDALEKKSDKKYFWASSIHYNTDNIHVHVGSVQLDKIDNRGKRKLSAIIAMKSSFTNSLVDFNKEYQKINEVIREKLVHKTRNHDLKNDRELKNNIKKIVKMLPKDKKQWHYNYNTLYDVRPLLDKITTQFIEENFKEDFKELNKLLEEQGERLKDLYGEGANEYYKNYSEGKIKELYTRMGNATLSNIKKYVYEEEKKKYMNRSNLTEKKPIITQKMINSFKRNLRKNFTSIKNQIEYEKLEREKEYLNNKIKINEYELE